MLAHLRFTFPELLLILTILGIEDPGKLVMIVNKLSKWCGVVMDARDVLPFG
jgi:hypothetical protein